MTDVAPTGATPDEPATGESVPAEPVVRPEPFAAGPASPARAASNRAGLALVLAVLALLGAGTVAVLVGTGVLRGRPSPGLTRRVDAAGQQVQALADQVRDLQARVVALSARPQVQPTDIGPLQARLAALEARPLPSASSAQDFAGLSARVDALASREDALSARQQADAAAASDHVAAAGAALRTDLTALGGRVDAGLAAGRSGQAELARQAEGLASKADVATLPARIAALEQRVAIVEKGSGQVAGLADRAQRLARLQSAEVALRGGQPLGPIPDAPPAVARFATEPAPTEAALRLAYPEAAERARVTSQPQTASAPLWNRMWARVQESVVVRQGDHVLVGDPAAGVLARAGDAVDAGDLAGAVAILGALHGPAAEAMRGWVGQAQALLDAQTALAALVARA